MSEAVCGSRREILYRIGKDKAGAHAVGEQTTGRGHAPVSPGARPPASPALCLEVPCPHQCPCVCASRAGAACMETSPSGTCGTQSSLPSAQAAAPSGEVRSQRGHCVSGSRLQGA